MESNIVELPSKNAFLKDLDQYPPESLRDPRLFVSRELSLLEFQKRVLSLALDDAIPLLERLRFLSISRALLDEFFEVRVAALKQRIQHGAARPGPDGLTPLHTLAMMRESALDIVNRQYGAWQSVLRPALAREGIRFLEASSWTERQRSWLHSYFRRELLPILSPLGLDPAHPFPRLLTKSLNFLVELHGRDAFGREGSVALVRAPRSLPRLIRIPVSYTRGPYDFVFLSSVLQAFMAELFPGMEIVGSHQFRVTRDSELLVDEEEIEDLASALRRELMDRGYSEGVRLEARQTCPPNVQKFLATRFELSPEDVYLCDGPVNLYRVTEVIDQIDRPDLCYPARRQQMPRRLVSKTDLFAEIRRGDILLHHPYQSFSPVLDLLSQAAVDPDVLAIKQTLYRTGVDSQVVNLLIEAARAGKDVTAVVELRARFDEDTNISLATRLQEAGVQVVYGIVGHKTHAKMLMIVRRERRKIRRYVHLGTGNYHSGTAKLYTDFGLLTCHQEITEDVQNLFQQLSGLGRVIELKRLLNSPFTLHPGLMDMIAREAEHARAGRPARIDAKLNSLTEPKIIRALYDAARDGVDVRLVVRGMCCLRPGIPGVSENIRVRSIIGRYLEHSRIYMFENGGERETWLSSADWMERNLFQRVEVAFPVLEPELSERVRREAIETAWEPRTEAWDMQPDGTYERTPEPDGRKYRHPQKRAQKKIPR
ncbi:polyphosphate kinase 1 [Marinihelvus fidelis]|uniref:Polyphosphate kinase n=1 Tax=Marinihelvus fidelis TaxID=2613842 RepID=A0A5N0T7P6_9GAMM|nr:polyphosphate kinase 1 [Marinihelvus fidelis]KAA9129846.1 polyphosphate kinase 1 [Marinihelvus fidelis]